MKTLALLMSVALLITTTVAVAAEPEPSTPLKVTAIDYSHPAGVSYDPSEALDVTITLKNTGDAAVDLSDAQWKATLSRERMIGPRDFWNSRFEDVKTVATGTGDGLPDTLGSGDHVELQVTFDPDQYGYFFVQFDPKGDGEHWLRLVGMAIVREPTPGPKPDSYYQAGGLLFNPEARAEVLGRFGFKKVRLSQRLSPEVNEDGSFDWARVDRVMAAAKRHDLLTQPALMPVAFFDPPLIGGKPITYFRGNKWNAVAQQERLGPASEPGTYAHYVKSLLTRYGDVIESVVIRNEPWEGGSISNWHVNSAYMRQALRIARSVLDEIDSDVKLLGTDSLDNTIDQVAIAGEIDLLDGITHHPYGSKYRDTLATAQAAGWGLQVYDNESWLAPEDMSIIAGNVMNLASGYRLMHSVHRSATMPALNNERGELITPRPIAQPLSTWLHFIEDTEHAEELHPDSLPHVHLFAGREGFDDKHAAVLFGRVKLYGHRAHNEASGDEVFPQLRGNGSLALTDADHTLRVFDMFGNELARESDTVTLPLNEYPYYVTSTAGYDDLRAKLGELHATYDDAGVELAMQDMTHPLDTNPQVRVHVANRVPTPQTVTLELTGPEGWSFTESGRTLTLSPGESRVVVFEPDAVRASPVNSYAMTATATTDAGVRELTESLHVAVFEKGTPTIDGNLDDWAELGAVPTYMSGEPIEVDYQQQMWFPTLNLEGRDDNEVWARFAGMWDENYFYVAAEVFDPTVGITRRFDDEPLSLMHAAPHDEVYWLFGIPGHATRTPEEQKIDGLKIAFNVLPIGEKLDPLFPKYAQLKTNPRFHRINPDYEYDLYLGQSKQLIDSYDTVLARHLEQIENPPNEKYAGKFPPFESPAFRSVGEPVAQVWRRLAPGVPRHRYYEFSPRHQKDQGIVHTAKLSILRDGDVVRYEAAIPWSELELVAPEIDKEVNFAYFVWDRGDLALNWAKGRSIANGAIQELIPFKTTDAIETPWRFIDAHP
jgi:hypothetical protein